MNAHDLDQALEQPYVAPAPAPSPLQLLGEGVAEAVTECALALARQHRLLDEHGQLFCWGCGAECDWHVSLHCAWCRVESKRQEPERRRREWLARQAEHARQQQERPARVPDRRFRDDD
jgi:hypothetical protein